MPIITISRGSHSYGKEVAEKVAQRLGYECMAREILLESSELFNIPEIKLARALHDAPSVLQRFTYGREKYVAYIESAFLEHVHKDNVVYHGLAGHFFLKGVSHVLKVRIIADLEDRVKLEMAREKISRDEAVEILKKDDYERRKWSLSLYGVDTSDSSLYDLVLHIRKITVDDAVDTIVRLAQLEHFQKTPASQQALDDLLLASQVKVSLVKVRPDVRVTALEGVVHVETQAPITEEQKVIQEIESVVRKVPGVQGVRVHVLPLTLYE